MMQHIVEERVKYKENIVRIIKEEKKENVTKQYLKLFSRELKSLYQGKTMYLTNSKYNK